MLAAIPATSDGNRKRKFAKSLMLRDLLRLDVQIGYREDILLSHSCKVNAVANLPP